MKVSKRGTPLKLHYFAAIGLFSVKTVADRYRHVAGHRLLRFVNIDDLEWPWTPKNGDFSEFFAILAAAHISRVNCDEMPEDRPKQPAYEIFSIKRKY